MPSRTSREQELSILHAIAKALNREVDLNSAIQVALAQVVELFNLRTGWIFLMDEETGEPYLAAYQFLPPALANEPGRMQGSCYCLDTYEEDNMAGAANVNIITCTRLKNLIDGTDGLQYHASIPLYDHGIKLGILNVVSRDWRELRDDELHLLYTVGELLSMAIQRARLFAKSHELGALSERNRLAREIHDTLAQGLTAITLQLETADVLIEAQAEPQRVQKFVQQALQLSRSNLVEARRSVLDLRAAPLQGRTLAEAIEILVTEIQAETSTQIRFQGENANRSLPSRLASSLYRIVQEALNNIAQHSQAEQATVKLIIKPDEIHLQIIDNGIGFIVEKVADGRYGLIGLQERAKLLGGQFCLQTAPHEGTQIDVIIPYTSMS